MSLCDIPEKIVSAIVAGDLAILEDYLNSGGDPDLLYRNRSLIHWAAQESDRESIRLLLARGASTEVADDEGHFPLYQAAAEGALETVQLLVEAGADVNHVCDSGTALSIACAYEHFNVVRYLVSVGADPEIPDKNGATARSISEGYESSELLRILKTGEHRTTPNGGSSASVDNSNASGGPPSVS
jgi:ankyrin repeat protein